MTKPVRLLPAARAEFDEAVDWYEQRGTGLGATFLARVRSAFDRISLDPQRHAAIHHDFRKILVPNFPYIVLYREDLDEILVISVFHTSRDPSIWRARL